MTWRPARSLTTLHSQLKASSRAAPPATDPNAWGLKGDDAHTSGDHVPRDFPGWGTEIVTAADFPNAPALGLDAHARLDGIRRSRDDRVKYAISNDQIFSSYATASRRAWAWGPYNPNDPNRNRHYDHGHLSVVGDARADDTRPWAIGGGMEQNDVVTGYLSKGNDIGDVLADVSNERDWWYAKPGEVTSNPPPAGSRADLVVRAAQIVLDTPADTVEVELTPADREAIADRVADLVVARLGALRFEPAAGQ